MFINAVDCVNKKGTEVTLSDEHIAEIAEAYESFETKEGFCKVISTEEILENNASLSVSLYATKTNATGNAMTSPEKAAEEWVSAKNKMHEEYNCLSDLIKEV